MELLRNPGNEYLLDASLKSLHSECVVWLSQLNFWFEEAAFFNNLLKQRKMSETVIEDIATVEKELERLRAGVLHNTRDAVIAHERLLASLYQLNQRDEDKCRYTHRTLICEMYSLHNAIRELRKKVFAWITK